MKLKKLLFAASFLTALSALSAHAGEVDKTAYGVALPDSARAERVVEIRPGARWANVVNGQTVKFVVGGKSFNWQVWTMPNVNSFDLDKIVPAEVKAAGIQVHVAASAQYQNS